MICAIPAMPVTRKVSEWIIADASGSTPQRPHGRRSGSASPKLSVHPYQPCGLSLLNKPTGLKQSFELFLETIRFADATANLQKSVFLKFTCLS
jgi:hypothetical protein